MLTNQQLKQLHKGILRTFNQRELNQLLSSQLGVDTTLFAQSDFSDFALDAINDADIQGGMQELLTILHNKHPHEPVFRKLIETQFSNILTELLPTKDQPSTLPKSVVVTASAVSIIIILFISQAIFQPSPSPKYAGEATGVIMVGGRKDATPHPCSIDGYRTGDDTPPLWDSAIITWDSAMIDKDFEVLTLGGKAPCDASIRVLLADTEIENVETSSNDEWIATTSVPSSGSHTVLVELLDDGKVIERFQRELEIPSRP